MDKNTIEMFGVIQPIPVEEEYDKNPDISPQDIKKLREWLKTQPHLPEKYISDLDLILAYSCCDKSAEVSKQLLDLHYTLRTHTSILMHREVNKSIITVLNRSLFAPLPTPTVNGYGALYLKLLDGDPKRYMFFENCQAMFMLMDLLQWKMGTWTGAVVIFDLDNATIGHLSRVDISTMREALYFSQEGILLKLKEVHIIKATNFVDKLLMMVRPFIKKSLMDIIFVHEKGSNSLDKFVDRDSLPKESGGKYKDYETIRDEIIKLFEDNKEYFETENLRRVNESLRPNGNKVSRNVLGLQGSFKKLDID